MPDLEVSGQDDELKPLSKDKETPNYIEVNKSIRKKNKSVVPDKYAQQRLEAVKKDESVVDH